MANSFGSGATVGLSGRTVTTKVTVNTLQAYKYIYIYIYTVSSVTLKPTLKSRPKIPEMSVHLQIMSSSTLKRGAAYIF